jgi:5-methylthioadenosine/S-adenosylhomocysteine deaminase
MTTPLPLRAPRLLISGGTLLTMMAGDEIHSDGAVLIEDGHILYAGPAAGLPPCPDAQRIDATGKAILPGLINAHTHLCMILGRTLGVERTLLEWLDIEMPLMRALDEQGMYDAQMLGLAENLKNGNTSVVENIFTPRTGPDLEIVAFTAMRDAGVRGIVARGYTGRNFAPDFVETAAQQDTRVRALARDWRGQDNGRLDLFISPLLPWSMSPEQFAETRRLTRDLGLGLHMHVAESPEFNTLIEKHFGKKLRNVELLAEMDCLGPDVQAVAVADLDAREIALLAETGTPVIFDPTTRLFWGTGFADIKSFLDQGISAALCTNGPAANCGQDLFESMKYACATAKTAARDPTALTARRALRMATIEGATVLGIADRVGSLEAGKRADLITVDLRQPHLTPAINVEAALVYAAKGSDVRDVIIDGRILLRDRTFTHLDEGAIIDRANAAASKAISKAGLAR